MIKSAAAILAAIKQAEKAGYVDNEIRRRPGRPWMGKKCKCTKYGVCYRAVVANDTCRSHHERYLRHGDYYAGGPFQPPANLCQYCEKQCFLRFCYEARTKRRIIKVVEHDRADGTRCPGSLRIPRGPRTLEEKQAKRLREQKRRLRNK